MAMAVLPHENIMCWMMTLGASGSFEMESLVVGKSCFEGE
jgi:hypothetical protein